MIPAIKPEEQSERAKNINLATIQVIVTQNGFVLKTQKGWFVYSNFKDMSIELERISKIIAKTIGARS